MSDINPFTGGTETPNDTPKVKIEYPLNWVQATSAGHMFEMNNLSLIHISEPTRPY